MGTYHSIWEGRTISANRARALNYFEGVMREKPQGVGATRAALSQMLRSIDLVGWSRNEESGRLDRKALSRLAAGATTVFSRRDVKPAEQSAVTVLVDCSGSMNVVMYETAELTIHLSKLLEQAKVNYIVTGFTGSEPQDKDSWDSDTGVKEQVLVTIPFKNRNESLRAAAHKMGWIPRCASSGNPDYAALMHGIEELAVQPEGRKILFFLTDTGSYDRVHMAHCQTFADRQGVTLIALGIKAKVATLFKHAAEIFDISDMSGKTFTTLLRTLRTKD